MTWENGPFCENCGRPTRFNAAGKFQCKQGCDRAAAEAQAMAAAQAQFNEAQAAVAEVGKRTTMPAPEPPTLTGPIGEVLKLLDEHPELEAPVAPEPEPRKVRNPFRRKKR